MILVDTSVWVDHFRRDDHLLKDKLLAGQVLAHPFVTGEIALGNLKQREDILASLAALPQAKSAFDSEVMTLIEHHNLAGCGIGLVDAHLVASTMITPGATLWTRDKRLRKIADNLMLSSGLP